MRGVINIDKDLRYGVVSYNGRRDRLTNHNNAKFNIF